MKNLIFPVFYSLFAATLLAGTLACSTEQKQTNTAATDSVSYEQIATESAAVVNQLRNAATEINRACPVQVDAATRLDSAQVLSPTELQFNYTLLVATRTNVNLAKLEATTRPALIQSVKTNSAMADLRDHSITIVYNYRDRNGEYLLKIPILPADYAR